MLFYYPELTSGASVVFDADESGHIVRVLRKAAGDEIAITDGRGAIVQARIVTANPKKCEVEILTRHVSDPDPYYIHIAVAPTKNMDRIAWFVEKAVEIGIHEISFPICRHSERSAVKTDKLLAKAISAMKQSLSAYLPKINDATSFRDFINNSPVGGLKYIAHLENELTPELISLATPLSKYCILIGPEGDFDASEVKVANEAGFEIVKLGNKRLRTETAALHACSLLNGLNYQAGK